MAPPHLRSWKSFTYAAPDERRRAVREWLQERREGGASLRTDESPAPIRIVLVGGPSSGKGTIGPMLSQAFRVRMVGAGLLLRGEVRARTQRGRRASAAMARGELLPDSMVLEALQDCLDCYDVKRNGWLLDGFPRTISQAEATLADEKFKMLRPDAVIVLERPDELIKEFMMGRMTDTATGQTYHPVYAPPPAELKSRVVWRLDDVPEVIDRRLAAYHAEKDKILAAYEDAGIPIAIVDNARSELETFREVAEFVEVVRLRKQELASMAEFEGAAGPDPFEDDVAELCDIDDMACLEEYDKFARKGGAAALLDAVRRCNTYSLGDYVPVVVNNIHVGYASHEMVAHLSPFLGGRMCRYTYLELPNAADGAPDEALRATPTLAIELAPMTQTLSERNEVVAELVKELVADGVIAAKSLRNELQEVRPMDTGFVGPNGPPPLVLIERAAMIHFGVPSYGIHVNGYVRDPNNPTDPRPHAVWVGVRSRSKATYPGLFDQMVAGGQPSSISLLENVMKECEEEASLPPDVVRSVRATGLVSYRYATRKGLSTKRLVTFDVEMPDGLTPICADGEVEEFRLIPIDEVLDSIRNRLPLWKPNAALVVIDFAMRHGLISPDEPGFVTLAQMLRAA